MATKKLPVTPAKPLTWQANLKAKAPQFAYLLAKDSPYGPGVTKILKQMMKEEWYLDPTTLLNNMTTALKNDPYWQNAGQLALNFDGSTPADQNTKIEAVKLALSSIPGAKELPPDQYEKLAKDAARRGISGPALSNLANSQIFSSRTPGQALPTDASQKALTSNESLDLDNMAKSYYQKASETDKQTLLTGKRTIADFEQDYREKSKALYPHLAAQLDKGMSLESIGANYKSYASQILEKPESDIDMFDSKYALALSTDDGKGGYRQLSAPEWATKLKTDKQYGWQYTQAANDQVRSLGINLAKTFGRVR